jgi:hypothetical protein
MRARVTDMWGCLVNALGAQYDLDSTMAGKLDFYGKIFAAAQQSGDTAAMVKWSGLAVQRLPNDVSMWRARLAALNTAGMTDSALIANQRIAQLDKTDIRPLFGMAQYYADKVKIDSTVPLDTATLGRVDSLLQRVVALKTGPGGAATDTTIWVNVALMYFKPATELVQKRVRPDFAATWLEKSEKYDLRKQLTTQAEFFIGLAYMFNMQNVFDFPALTKSKSCRQLGSLGQYVQRIRSAMTAGASVQQSTADQVIKNIAGIEKFVTDAGKAWKCPG